MNEWKQIALGDVATFHNGYTFKSSDWSSEGAEIIRIQNLTKSSANINYFKGELSEKYKVRKGDILISWSATLGVYEWESNDAWLNQHLFKVVFDKEDIDRSFFKYLIKTSLKKLESQIQGATMKHITRKKFDAYPVNLPPLDQQKKIAAILDAADAYRQKTKALIEKYDELTQSLFLDMFGDPVTNPKGFELIQLREVTSKIGSGSTPRGGKEAYKKDGISLVRSLNVHNNEFKHKNLAFIDENQASKLQNVILEEEDVLYNITGASICRCCIIPSEILPGRVNQHVAILRPKKDVLNSKFLMYCLISENVKNSFLSIGLKGGATREAITKADLENYKLPFPKISLQNQFANIVQAIEEQKVQAQESLAKAEDLFNSLLQRAFKGELTN